jgi:hypothetical protein
VRCWRRGRDGEGGDRDAGSWWMVGMDRSVWRLFWGRVIGNVAVTGKHRDDRMHRSVYGNPALMGKSCSTVAMKEGSSRAHASFADGLYRVLTTTIVCGGFGALACRKAGEPGGWQQAQVRHERAGGHARVGGPV